MTLANLPRDILLDIATLNADPSVYAALSLAVPRLGRALIQPRRDILTSAHLDVFRSTTYPCRSEPYLRTWLGFHLHSFRDEPALTYGSNKYWYHHGKIHRDGDRPAIERECGDLYWYQHGQLHRNGDQPAFISNFYSKLWARRGRLHREGIRPAVVVPNGHIKAWYLSGQRIRMEHASWLSATEAIKTLEHYETIAAALSLPTRVGSIEFHVSARPKETHLSAKEWVCAWFLLGLYALMKYYRIVY